MHGLLDGVGATGMSLVAGADEPQLVYWAAEPNPDVNTDPLFGGIVVESLGANGEAPAPGRFTDGFWRVSVNAVAFDGDTLLGMTEPYAGASGLSGASVAPIGDAASDPRAVPGRRVPRAGLAADGTARPRRRRGLVRVSGAAVRRAPAAVTRPLIQFDSDWALRDTIAENPTLTFTAAVQPGRGKSRAAA